jgi:two-component system, sensor histidine kinase LadS
MDRHRLTLQKLSLRLLIMMAAFWCVCAFGVPRSDASRQPEGVLIGQIQVFEDPKADATLDQILGQRHRFRPVVAKTPNYNFSSSAFWFHLTVQNQRNQPTALFLEEKHPAIDDLTLYVVHSDNRRDTVYSGDSIPARNRPYPGSTLVMPFLLDSGESADLYLRARSDAGTILVPLEFLDERSLEESLLGARLFHGVMLGLFLSLFIYNLFIYALLREKSYLYYMAYLPFAYLTITSLDGFGSGVLYPGTTWPGNEGLVVFSGITFFLILSFTRAFLRTSELGGLDRWVKLLIAASVFLAISPLVLTIRVAYQIDVLMVFVFPILCFWVGLAAWRRGRIEARFYVLGQAASWIGLLVFGLLIIGVLPYHLLLFEGISIGISADALLLSLALADKIRILQKARLLAEDIARRNLEVRQEELERIVTERTTELNLAREKAEFQATIDSLTGIYNRRGLLEKAEREVKLALRSGRPLSVVMLDIDHFKRVNDAHGHARGDKVLRDLASSVGRDMRSTDLFGRVGGEEFLLVLPDTSRESAVQLAERLREHIAKEVSVGVPPMPVTASFGVAWITGSSRDLDRLQSEADSALYRAKQKGRNRVESADLTE